MKNALSRIIFLCLMAGAGLLPAQQELEFTNGCNFASDKTAGKYTLFETTEEAEKIVDEILNLSGITGDRPFTLQVATVDNAQANERKGVRYLLYSNKFMGDFKVEGKTKWAAYFVFAHEIGHLVRGHNFSETDVKARKKMELEADRFAAVAMARMRASRNDALAAAQNLKALNKELASHSKRLAATPQIVVATKMDLTGADTALAGLRRLFRKAKIYPLSSATGKGVKELMGAVVKALQTAPEPAAFTPDIMDIVIEPDFKVEQRSDGEWHVQGKKVNTLVAVTNFDQDEAVSRFQNILIKLGVEEALVRAGARTGDSVCVSDHRFTFRPSLKHR